MQTTLEKETSRIAKAIVELVNRADGPVTFFQLEREIPGFAKKEPPGWSYRLADTKQALVWGAMTEAGGAALREVLRGHRVAVQFVNPLPYLIEGDPLPADADWQPTVLLPAKAANVYSPKVLIRGSPLYVSTALQEPGFRPLKPGQVSGTADRFSL
jgi:hypothetical protein